MLGRPFNIVYLHTHDAGRYVQPYGFPLSTPNLMQFAKEGVLFRKCFAAAPTCGPSRAALLSGQYPHEVGMYGLPNQGWAFDQYGKHLVHTMNEVGYETALAGCQHETGKSEDEIRQKLGYQRLLNVTREQKGAFFQESINHVERYLAEKKTKPFFLSIGLDAPHRNNLGREELGIGEEGSRFSRTRYYDPDRLDWRYVAPPPFMPDLPVIRKDMAAFAEGVSIMDEYMGRVLYAIRHYGYEENTLVIVTTDHGIEFPGGKKTLSDQGIGVMLMLRGPFGFQGGKVIESIVSQIDIFPTLCELLGIERMPWLSGVSLMPLLEDADASVRDEIFAEQTYHGKFEPLRCIRTDRYKLIVRTFGHGPIMRHDGPSSQVMEKAGFYERDLGHVELFDLYLDPWECCNRAEAPEYREIREDLEKRLLAWMNETNDPFADGSFPKPPGG